MSGTVEGVGLPDVNLTSTSSNSGHRAAALASDIATGGSVIGCWSSGSVGGRSVGGLVGRVQGRLAASWSSATVTGTGSNSTVGGLAGILFNGAIVASYATGTVSGRDAGGLVGFAAGGNVRASYAIGAVTATRDRGGITGRNDVAGESYTDVMYGTSTGATTGNCFGCAGRSASALQTPTAATGIYVDWDDLDVNGNGDANEDPWHFGTSSQYPVLRYGTQDPGLQRGDYDGDDDGLIEVRSLRQLNAIRWDLNGDGTASTGDEDKYESAYYDPPSGMGCPATGCTGYELDEDLDFDTDGSGSTHTGGTGDRGDAYYNGGAGFSPIGTRSAPFNATFDGQGKIIDNLFVNRATTGNAGRDVGLFGGTGSSAVVTSVGLRDVHVASASSGVGALVGRNGGRIAASWASGAVSGASGGIGGLVGSVDAARNSVIVASYSTASVTTTTGGGTGGAGLVGWNGD